MKDKQNEARTDWQIREKWKAEYEKEFGRFRSLCEAAGFSPADARNFGRHWFFRDHREKRMAAREQ